MNSIQVKVVSRRMEAERIASFELARIDGGALPPFSAGAHIDVEIRPGLVRQYSLCNDPDETHRYLIAVLRDAASRGGSVAMHDDLQVGSTLRISEPKNHFPLVPAPHYLLFAGGIGVTPILCMAERLARTGARFTMHYCARSPGHAAFADRIALSGFAGRVHFHFDSGAAEQKLDLSAVLAQAQDALLYVCGPAGFIDFVTGAAKAAGWPAHAVHQEYFGMTPQDSSDDTAFDVRIASSGNTYRVPADQTVAQALAEHGIDIPMSCEQGVCGTCITRVLDGMPDHRDMYFSDEEKACNDQFTPCCSRARSPLLVLDL
ncbi:PDR/VanB family oxidoreductase [Massilia sp. METH4]|uniref:PDR/VanB family oxidoreductase n=1 Tax=Massilia sp. METH4 TaxID=3123041 RepID=UPI0030D62061